MKLSRFAFIMVLLLGMSAPRDIDAEIIKDLDFFENLDILADEAFEITEEEKVDETD